MWDFRPLIWAAIVAVALVVALSFALGVLLS